MIRTRDIGDDPPAHDDYEGWFHRTCATNSRWASFERRSELTRKFAFAIPCKAALDALALLGPIVEMGAGTGYWAYLLRKRCVDIVAYDRHLSGDPDHPFHFSRRAWTQVLIGTPPVLAEHTDRALFLCWPDYDTEFASQCLQHYQGSTIAYIGEGSGGCTADDAFHDRLDCEWRADRRIELPQWPGATDDLYIYRRELP